MRFFLLLLQLPWTVIKSAFQQTQLYKNFSLSPNLNVFDVLERVIWTNLAEREGRMGWWRCPGAFLISCGYNMQMLSPHRAWQSISWTCLPAHALCCNLGAFSGCKLDHIILLLKTFKGFPFRMQANPLKRFTWLFLPGPRLSFLSHSVIQQVLIVCLFYAQEKA